MCVKACSSTLGRAITAIIAFLRSHQACFPAGKQISTEKCGSHWPAFFRPENTELAILLLYFLLDVAVAGYNDSNVFLFFL